ncbi:Valine--tRNA ligase [Candidatus Fokinia solitaria]|uniref:Valine--tRNA ligase n=1 Tax=Candidatus Fokinia solitaria TaxID=1802984 RepID=A0A2U8BRV9_9RICK|nr:valine--tRNA ligase [Candidatus Fokinia solitaria]AWD33072.1 Valine--tRNA ligase [Candidatus Fokinia solitaria]
MYEFTKYNHDDIESRIRLFWDSSKLYQWQTACKREVFSIDSPPPTVSGNMHIGHLFSYSHTDFIARFKRMCGYNVFYSPGFDDNGLPTERLIEKEYNIVAHRIDKADFIQKCSERIVKFHEQFRTLLSIAGFTYDWTLQYNTISEKVQRLSQLSFTKLYHRGIIYRKEAPVFWDHVDQTAISQAEIEDKEFIGRMYELVFSISDKQDDIIIATTRPEMLYACKAVLIHPQDQRYRKLIGASCIVPISHHIVPIIEDISVDMQKGTGAVMCCTFGDAQDVEWWRIHKFTCTNVITKNGLMENSGLLNGMKIKAARTKIVELLEQEGVLKDSKEVVQHVKCAERSGAPLEIIVTQQWYINVMRYKDKLMAQVHKINWHPDYMRIRVEQWIDNLNQDWCISRQRYFGIPFPVWYSKKVGEEGKVIVAEETQLPLDPAKILPRDYTKDDVVSDSDVMDTWATSTLSPQINVASLKETDSSIFPFSLRTQAHEIIRTWAFGTIAQSLFHEDNIPWHNIMISGWCLGKNHEKMSKSKGNIIEPLTELKAHGADAIRYWAATAPLGTDIAYSDDIIKDAKRFLTKLFNASRFCAQHLERMTASPSTIENSLHLGEIEETYDIWLLNELLSLTKSVFQHYNNFDYCHAMREILNFFWKTFCDYYIEIVKNRVYLHHSAKAGNSAALTMYYAISIIVKLIAPITPYIAEEIFQKIILRTAKEKSNTLNHDLSLSSVHSHDAFPKHIAEMKEIVNDNTAISESLNVISIVRKFRSERKIAMNKMMQKIILHTSIAFSKSLIDDLTNVLCVEQLVIDDNKPKEINNEIFQTNHITICIFQ